MTRRTYDDWARLTEEHFVMPYHEAQGFGEAVRRETLRDVADWLRAVIHPDGRYRNAHFELGKVIVDLADIIERDQMRFEWPPRRPRASR